MQEFKTSPQLEQILALKPDSLHAYRKDIESIVGSYYFTPVDCLMGIYANGVKLELGVEGMPNTSKKLVSLGILRVQGDTLKAHPQIVKTAAELSARFDALLARLKHINSQTPPLSNDEISETLRDFMKE